MATTDPTPTNPTIAAAGTPIPGPCTPDAFRTSANTYVAKQQTSVQTTAAFLELLQAALGNGALSGGAIAAGAGLSVTVATLTAFVGTYVNITGSTTVGSLANGSLNYLYLYQDGTFTSNTTGVLPVSSGGHGQAFLWGTATTSGGAVTAVSNVREYFRLAVPLNQQRDTVAAAETVVVSDTMQVDIYDSLTVYGSLAVYGKVRVI